MQTTIIKAFTSHKEGRLEEAEKLYRLILKVNPTHPEVNNNLGAIQHNLAKYDDAEKFYKKAIEHKPDFAEAYFNLGATLDMVDRLEETEICYKKAIENKQNYIAAYNNLGSALLRLNKLEEAENIYKKIIKSEPNLIIAHNSLGIILQKLNKSEEAEACFKKAINLKPDFTESYYNLSLLKKFDKDDEYFIKMQKLYINKSLSDENRYLLCFALGKISEDLFQFDKSFKYYSEGNSLRKKLLNYNIDEDIQLFSKLKKTHPIIKKNCLTNPKLDNKIKPIFIVGMPRSGTTLIEQIISSHSKVTGLGELDYFDQFGKSKAQGISKIDKNILLDFREKYFKKLDKLTKGNFIITDKMMLNFRYIGLIYSTFPEAKIIHVKRDPAATCWSNYKINFLSNNINFSFDLNNIVIYYKLYKDLMKFWEQQYKDRIYNLVYEKLVTNQEDETKKLIQHLDLTWEDQCLNPHKNKRVVHTASSTQVKKKIYQDSSEKWKKFRPFLNGELDDFDSLIAI